MTPIVVAVATDECGICLMAAGTDSPTDFDGSWSDWLLALHHGEIQRLQNAVARVKALDHRIVELGG